MTGDDFLFHGEYRSTRSFPVTNSSPFHVVSRNGHRMPLPAVRVNRHSSGCSRERLVIKPSVVFDLGVHLNPSPLVEIITKHATGNTRIY